MNNNWNKNVLPSNEAFNEKMQKVNEQLIRLNNRMELIEKVDQLPVVDNLKYKKGSKVLYVYDNNVYEVNKRNEWQLYALAKDYYTKDEIDAMDFLSELKLKTINGHSLFGEGDLPLRLGTEIPLENVWTIDQVQNFVKTQIASLIDSAPDTLDTLGELATALKQNNDVVVTLNAAITKKADKAYVDQAIQNSFDTMFETLMDLEV